MRLPTYDEIAKDTDQLDVFETPVDRSLFVIGPPGSGKTTLAIHRAMIASKLGTRVAVITYNRMLRRTIAQTIREEIKVQTMHAFVWEVYRRLVDEDPPRLRGYDYDWPAIHEQLRCKRKKPFPAHVIVDEGQDLPSEFYIFLREFVAKNITVFADDNQAIESNGSSVSEIKVAGRFDDPILLETNHRNSPEIERVASFYHTGDNPILEVARPSTGEVPRVIFYENWAADRIVAWYKNRGGNVGAIVVRNDFGMELYGRLRQRLSNARIDFYRSSQKNEDSINLHEPGVTVLNVKSAKGQEFDTVFLLETEELLCDFSLANKRKMYMLCSRARDHLFLLFRGDHLLDGISMRLPAKDILKRP